MHLQASVAAKDNNEGALLLDALKTLPLILMSSSGGMTQCVWRGFEVGAAEVLETPLSAHKLQNLWQHVVRRVRALIHGVVKSSLASSGRSLAFQS